MSDPSRPSANASLRTKLLGLYWPLQKAIVPGLKSSQWEYYRRVADVVPGAAWLDIGCGHQVFGEWMRNEEAKVLAAAKLVIGIDMDFTGLRAHAGIRHKCMADAAALPFSDASFDLVTANMVVEHVQAPRQLLAEVSRVLKPGGRFIFHTPNKYGYVVAIARCLPETLKKTFAPLLEGRAAGDVFPAYYRLNSLRDIEPHAAGSGIVVESVEPVSTGAATAVLGPFSVFELLLIRLLRSRALRTARPCVIACLRKSATEGAAAEAALRTSV